VVLQIDAEVCTDSEDFDKVESGQKHRILQIYVILEISEIYIHLYHK